MEARVNFVVANVTITAREGDATYGLINIITLINGKFSVYFLHICKFD